MTKEELQNRTKNFAVKVFQFLMNIEKKKETDVISNQLLRASSSVAANYRAACRGKSSDDFLYKLKIVNGLFWLEFIDELEIKCNKDDIKLLILEANELVSIFTSSIKTLDSKIKKS
ncbi:MAG TPA: four helix bundle protein [Bacteroidales bacterium]|nr:four helix bundle protein [Bacteroidales bacterium]